MNSKKNKKSVRIIVEVKGGVVQSVYSSRKDVRVDVLDWDNVGGGDDADAELDTKTKLMYEVFST